VPYVIGLLSATDLQLILRIGFATLFLMKINFWYYGQIICIMTLIVDISNVVAGPHKTMENLSSAVIDDIGVMFQI
jgi:hypothetical protein